MSSKENPRLSGLSGQQIPRLNNPEQVGESVYGRLPEGINKDDIKITAFSNEN